MLCLKAFIQVFHKNTHSDSGREASPLGLPLHPGETCCIIGIIMGSTAPPWTWQVNPSNKTTKASILVTANNLNVCSNHSREFLQSSCFSQTGEGKKGSTGERVYDFFLLFLSLKMRFLRTFMSLYVLSTTFLITRCRGACSEKCSIFKTDAAQKPWKWRDLQDNLSKSLTCLTSSSLPIL